MCNIPIEEVHKKAKGHAMAKRIFPYSPDQIVCFYNSSSICDLTQNDNCIMLTEYKSNPSIVSQISYYRHTNL